MLKVLRSLLNTPSIGDATTFSKTTLSIQHNNVQHNGIRHNYIQHNNTQRNAIQHDDIQQNDIQHNMFDIGNHHNDYGPSNLSVVMLSVVASFSFTSNLKQKCQGTVKLYSYFHGAAVRSFKMGEPSNDRATNDRVTNFAAAREQNDR